MYNNLHLLATMESIFSSSFVTPLLRNLTGKRRERDEITIISFFHFALDDDGMIGDTTTGNQHIMSDVITTDYEQHGE